MLGIGSMVSHANAPRHLSCSPYQAPAQARPEFGWAKWNDQAAKSSSRASALVQSARIWSQTMRVLFLLLAVRATAPRPAAAADQFPRFDIARNCSFEASGGAALEQTAQQTKEACKQDETTAKKQLSQEWSRFKGEAKRDCLEESSMGSEQSYVELQSCLEMSSNWTNQTVGQAPLKALRQ
jgi:hypothetical protein